MLLTTVITNRKDSFYKQLEQIFKNSVSTTYKLYHVISKYKDVQKIF
jgi:hypothetical protein